MIDLHTHILPGIDDGPDHFEGSVTMARVAWESGTHIMAATPHLRDDHPGVRPAELVDRCKQLETVLHDAGVGLRVVPAGEVDLVWATSASDEDLTLVSYGQRGGDMLVETPYGPLPPAFDELLWRIASRGFRLLLAHPERNPSFQRRPERVVELVRRGVLIQLTAGSLATNDRRSRSRAAARWLVEQGAAHVLASDSHSAEWRGPDMRAGIAAVKGISPARADWMVNEVPPAILAGEPLPPIPSTGGSLSRLLGRLGR